MAIRGVYLIATASLLMMLQCCNHLCVCDEYEVTEDAEDDDLLLEVEVEEETFRVFEPTHEWKTVEEGQAIPAGLHIRMNLETGKKEARLMDKVPTEREKTEDKSDDPDTKTPQNQQQREPPPVGGAPPPGFRFHGDHRRAHHYGHSDRRGIINRRLRIFSQREVAATLRKIDESNAQIPKKVSGRITHSQPSPGDPPPQRTAAPSGGRQGVKVAQQERGGRMERALHRELAEMLRHAKTLARKSATVPELLQALEELEYHVHQIDNARELNTVGGLVVVVRLLNHSHPDVRSSAAHVIGAATQR